MKSLNYIDLFAGAGGLSEGFVREGYQPIAHVEMDPNACDTLRTRIVFHYLSGLGKEHLYHDYLRQSIDRETLYRELPQELHDSVICREINSDTIGTIFSNIDQRLAGRKVDVVIGGPPCQAYSLVGRSRDPKRMQEDDRNYLFKFYAQFLSKYKPKLFVFENVLGLLSAGNKKYLNEMLQLFSEIGYTADYKVLSAEDYGILQKRRRVIIIGHEGKKSFKFPDLEGRANGYKVKSDLFYDLPVLRPGEEMHVAPYTQPINAYLKVSNTRNGIDFVTQHITRQHNERDLEIYSIAIEKWLRAKERLKYDELPSRLQTHNKKDIFLDRFKVVDPEGHSHTIVAHIAKDGHYYIYPDPNQVRSISVREAARIQSFPDDYFFEGGRTAAFKQIGNAVPPLMAQVIAKALKSILA